MSSKRERMKKQFLDFDVLKESWNLYDLKDGTQLKTKFVLITVIEEPASDGFSLGFTSKIVVGAIPPIKLMGQPSSPYTQEELRSSIAKPDIDVENSQEVWNSYRLENGIVLKIKNVLVNVSRTKKFDSKGIPIYLVDTNAIVKVSKKDMDRLSKDKRIVKVKKPRKKGKS